MDTPYTTSMYDFSIDDVRCLDIDDDGLVWMVDRSCLVSFNGSDLTVYDESIAFLSGDQYYTITIEDDGTKWIGTFGNGLISFDDGVWTEFNQSNSGIPGNIVSSIAIDSAGVKWIGTEAGVASFDGNEWTVFSNSNSDLPTNWIYSIAIDGNGTKWIGTDENSETCGLVSFDGNNWTMYDETNSNLLPHAVSDIAIDDMGAIWVVNSCFAEVLGGGWSRLVSFDGTTWTEYDIPIGWDSPVETDQNSHLWFWTDQGLASFDGTDMQLHNESGPSSWIYDDFHIGFDENGNKWIGAGGALSVFNEDGVILGLEERLNVGIPADYRLHQNFPNPFNPTTTISYDLTSDSDVTITVYDITGRSITTLRNSHQPAGAYNIQWNGVDDSGNPASTGVYFAQLQAGATAGGGVHYSKTIKMVILR